MKTIAVWLHFSHGSIKQWAIILTTDLVTPSQCVESSLIGEEIIVCNILLLVWYFILLFFRTFTP